VVPRYGVARSDGHRGNGIRYHPVTPRTFAPPRGTTCTTCTTRGESEQTEFTSSRLQPPDARLRPTPRRPASAQLAQAGEVRGRDVVVLHQSDLMGRRGAPRRCKSVDRRIRSRIELSPLCSPSAVRPPPRHPPPRPVAASSHPAEHWADRKEPDHLHQCGQECISGPKMTDGRISVALAKARCTVTGNEFMELEPTFVTIAPQPNSGSSVAPIDTRSGNRSNGAHLGLRNFETRTCDAGALPFPDASFDAVLCRFGFMFFPDVKSAAREFARVAKPGARVCAAVWSGPDKNPWATTIMGTIARHVEIPPPPPGSPGLFRCAPEGTMRRAFDEAGLRDVNEEEVATLMVHETPDHYWQFMTEIAAPVVAGLAKADAHTREKSRTEAVEVARRSMRDGPVQMLSTATVIVGTR
jgi:SAM-dependent methyltransferase